MDDRKKGKWQHVHLKVAALLCGHIFNFGLGELAELNGHNDISIRLDKLKTLLDSLHRPFHRLHQEYNFLWATKMEMVLDTTQKLQVRVGHSSVQLQ